MIGPCCSPCPTVQTVNTPGPSGGVGTNGSNGADGKNGYTVLTSDFTVPGVGFTSTAAVGDTSWMVIGQIVVLGNKTTNAVATCIVTAIPSLTAVTLQFLGYPGDVAANTVIASGGLVGPSGVMPPLTTYPVVGAGTAFQLTNAFALLALGTTTPVINILAPGTYLVFGRVRIDYNAATLSTTERVVSLRVRQTNNTAATVSSAAFKTPLITTLTYTAMVVPLPPTVLVVASAGTILELEGMIDAVANAGSVDAVEAELLALRIA